MTNGNHKQNVTVFSGELLCKGVRWVKIRKTCLLYTWALSLKIAYHKNRNLWKLHVKLPFQIAKMKFTWNSLHENFTWYITWPSSDNVSHEIHEKILRKCHIRWCCMCISSLMISKDIVFTKKLLYMITKRKQLFFVCFLRNASLTIRNVYNPIIQ